MCFMCLRYEHSRFTFNFFTKFRYFSRFRVQFWGMNPLVVTGLLQYRCRHHVCTTHDKPISGSTRIYITS